VIEREIEKAGVPAVLITAMTSMAMLSRAIRTIAGIKIAHPCGNPQLSFEEDKKVRFRIVEYAINALQASVDSPTIFEP